MEKLVIGILAHVDAGKTTLSESILYHTGRIGKLGRVDNQDAYLDNYALERARGITIFAKQAVFSLANKYITLLDTPGHVDFSAEMERALQVLDYAVLIVSGSDGVQGHTRTLWKLLKSYHIPVFIFVNKMDQKARDREAILNELKKEFGDGCIDFKGSSEKDKLEDLAMCSEALMEAFLNDGKIEEEAIAKAVWARQVFPCYFGSALKLDGIDDFLEGLDRYTQSPVYPESFGAKVFKITRDDQGNRLTHMKITGGRLKVREIIKSDSWEEKVNQIRIYSGTKFEAQSEVEAGMICAVTGLTLTQAGESLGSNKMISSPLLMPVLSYQMILPEGYDPRLILPKLKLLEEEAPELRIVWNELLQEIQVQLMGEVQIEILETIIKERFDLLVRFDEGRIVYKETIANTVEGVGHFEPLRHYAEVHLLLEPAEAGSGISISSICSEDVLSKNWQKSILNHLKEKEHRGVLIGANITDIHIALVSGRAHNKHTEGGDFREATYRAVRQGLKEAESVILEPFYRFQLELPEKLIGRGMSDIEQMGGLYEIQASNGDMAVITGSAPVINMRNYQKEVTAYSKGFGRLSYSFEGYKPCHNQAELVDQMGYDAERDLENPTGSVFCENGVGFLVDWDEVKAHMHLESYFKESSSQPYEREELMQGQTREEWISLEEIDEIMTTTYSRNQGKKSVWKKPKSALESYYESVSSTSRVKETEKEYLLVDGYNIIYAWPELKVLADENLDNARTKLLDLMCNYQAIKKCEVIVVFDAYKVKGRLSENLTYHNIHVIYTQEAQTADHYIEKFVHENKKRYHIAVATSDGLEQIIIRGAGSYLLSARDLKIEIEKANEMIQRNYQNTKTADHNHLEDTLSEEVKQKIEKMGMDH